MSTALDRTFPLSCQPDGKHVGRQTFEFLHVCVYCITAIFTYIFYCKPFWVQMLSTVPGRQKTLRLQEMARDPAELWGLSGRLPRSGRVHTRTARQTCSTWDLSEKTRIKKKWHSSLMSSTSDPRTQGHVRTLKGLVTLEALAQRQSRDWYVPFSCVCVCVHVFSLLLLLRLCLRPRVFFTLASASASVFASTCFLYSCVWVCVCVPSVNRSLFPDENRPDASIRILN